MSEPRKNHKNHEKSGQEDESKEPDSQEDLSAVEAEEARLNAQILASLRKARTTTRFGQEERYAMPDIFGRTFGVVPVAPRYFLKPDSMDPSKVTENTPLWRIELHDLKAGAKPLGIDVAGDVVLGRSSGGPFSPDVDLDAYDALIKGVSRRHALLRPTKNRLYILDLGSTNGTMRNSVPLGKGVARPLENNDTLTLGRLSFSIKLIAGPGTGQLFDVESHKPLPRAQGVEGIAGGGANSDHNDPEEGDKIRVDLPESNIIIVPRKRDTSRLVSKEGDQQDGAESSGKGKKPDDDPSNTTQRMNRPKQP